MGLRMEDFIPIAGMLNGKGMFGDMLGKKSELEDEQQKVMQAAADQKSAQDKAASQANAQQWANSRTGMKKGGAVKKKMAEGGKVYTEKMGKPPQDIDGKSAGKVDKKDAAEQPGSGIFVDGKPIKKAKGGMVGSSASRRADGIASKGKTRGKMC